MKRKVISWVLALTMLLSLGLPSTAAVYADEETETPAVTTQDESKGENEMLKTIRVFGREV